jgi:hypothetical protein
MPKFVQLQGCTPVTDAIFFFVTPADSILTRLAIGAGNETLYLTDFSLIVT